MEQEELAYNLLTNIIKSGALGTANMDEVIANYRNGVPDNLKKDFDDLHETWVNTMDIDLIDTLSDERVVEDTFEESVTTQLLDEIVSTLQDLLPRLQEIASPYIEGKPSIIYGFEPYEFDEAIPEIKYLLGIL